MPEPREPLEGKRDLVREIAQDTRLDPKVITLVLDKFTDIAVEELANYGTFPLAGFFTVTVTAVKGGHRGVDGRVVEPSWRLRLKVARRISKLYRLQQETFRHQPFLVNRDTWRGALKWAMEQRKPFPLPSSGALQEKHTQEVEDNPFLHDDGED